jgi:hypothetical protein
MASGADPFCSTPLRVNGDVSGDHRGARRPRGSTGPLRQGASRRPHATRQGRRSHADSLRGRQIRGELLAEALLPDQRSVAPSPRRTACSPSPSVLPGNMPARRKTLSLELARGRRRGRGRRSHLRRVRPRDHRAARGVGDKHDRPVNRADRVADGSRVGGEPPQWVRDRDDPLTRCEQPVDHAILVRGFGERAVDEKDRRSHENVPFARLIPSRRSA